MAPGENIETDTERDRADLGKDVLFDLLQNNRRRAALRTLDEEGKLTLSELAEIIAAEESDGSQSEPVESARRSVYISLYQRHIPKLEKHDVVAYDREKSTVELLDTASQLLSHIYLDEHRSDSGGSDSTLSQFFRELLDQ